MRVRTRAHLSVCLSGRVRTRASVMYQGLALAFGLGLGLALGFGLGLGLAMGTGLSTPGRTSTGARGRFGKFVKLFFDAQVRVRVRVRVS